MRSGPVAAGVPEGTPPARWTSAGTATVKKTLTRSHSGIGGLGREDPNAHRIGIVGGGLPGDVARTPRAPVVVLCGSSRGPRRCLAPDARTCAPTRGSTVEVREPDRHAARAERPLERF